MAYRGEIDGMSTSGVEVIDAISEVHCQGANNPTCRDPPQNPQDPDYGSPTAKSIHPVTVVSVELVDAEDPWYKFW